VEGQGASSRGSGTLLTMAQNRSIRLGAAVLTALITFTLVGCSSAPTTSAPSAAADFVHLIEKVPGIIEVNSFDLETTAVVAAVATDDIVLGAASAIEEIANDANWGGKVTLFRGNPDPNDDDTDTMPRPAWSLTVFPAEADRVADELAGILALEKMDGTTDLTIHDGWPYVTLASIDTFAADVRTIAAAPLFEHGGTFKLDAEKRLRIVWVPKRTSLEAVAAIVKISADYPEAEVLLEATTEGPQWPKLWVAHVTTEQAAAIEQQLLAPELADADSDGYALPFMLTVIGPDGPVYTEGSFGGVVE
jgi:hypothetical protein